MFRRLNFYIKDIVGVKKIFEVVMTKIKVYHHTMRSGNNFDIARFRLKKTRHR